MELERRRDSQRIGYIVSRMHREFDLAILTIFAGVAGLVIAGFSVYRFLSGSIVGGIIDLFIALGAAGIVLYGWRGSNVAQAGAIFVWFAVVACVASAFVFGRTAAYWTFLVLSISFVITGRRVAIVGNVVLISAIAMQTPLFPDNAERAIFIVTALLVTMYGWVFDARYKSQRVQLEILASQDPLTQVGNRRVMRRDLMHAVTENRRSSKMAYLAVLDLDHFKDVNDAYGHEAGDQVLIRLTDIVRDRLRRDDGLYRLGGEEFVVLLPKTGPEQARVVLEDLLRLFREAMQKSSMPVTVSIGAALVRQDEDWSAWLRRADQAMYKAKQAGRNRLVMSEEDG